MSKVDTGHRFSLFKTEWSNYSKGFSFFEVWSFQGEEHHAASLIAINHCMGLKFVEVSFLFMNYLYLYGEDDE